MLEMSELASSIRSSWKSVRVLKSVPDCFSKCEHNACADVVKAIRKSVRKHNPKYAKKCFDCPYCCDICCIFEIDKYLP